MAVGLVGTVGTFANAIPRATGSFQISSPGAAVSAGDVACVLVVYDYDGGDPDSITIPGFSRLGDVAVPSLTNGFSPYAQLLVKESAGSEPASYTVSKWTTGGGNNTDFAALSWALTGVDAADLVAGSSPVWVGTAQSTSQTLPSVTPDEAPGMVIWLLANQRFSDPPTTTVSTPAGTTEIGFVTSTFAFAKAVYQLYATTDPTGTKTATIGPTGPGSPGAALGVAIREATTPPPSGPEPGRMLLAYP